MPPLPAPLYGVGGDTQSARIDRENCDIARGDRIARHFARDGLKRNAVAACADNLAIGDAHGAALTEVQKSAPFRERNIGAVEDKAADPDMVAADWLTIIEGPPAMTMRDAPATPAIDA